MTTPRLNRIFTVSGSSTETVLALILWGINSREDASPDAAGEWTAFAGFPRVSGEKDASDVVSERWSLFEIYADTVNPDGSQQTDVAAWQTLREQADEGHFFRLYSADGESYLQATVDFLSGLRPAEIEVDRDSWELVGEDFTIPESGYLAFALERHQAEQSITTVTARPAWGELSERGSALGVIDLTVGGQAVTGSQEEANAVVRYDADLAIGTMLTDDLDRVWTIRGSRTVGNRRYLEFDLVRTVQAVG